MSALFLAAVGMQVGGQVFEGLSFRDQAKNQAKLYEAQAAEDIFQAEQEKEATYRNQLQAIRQGKALKGTQVARAGASGATAESFLPVMIDTAKELELDRYNLALQGKQRESQFRRRAVLSRYNARISKIRGRNALTASLLGAAGTGTKGALEYKELYT